MRFDFDLDLHLPFHSHLELLLSLALCITIVGGCDASFVDEGPTKECVEVGVQCTLSGGGPLGVCEQIPCSSESERNCFVCTPQH